MATVPAEEIQKIEILRGPEAAIYGPGAIGGMINVLTAPSASFLNQGLKISGFVRGSAASAANKAASTAGLTLTGKQLQLSGNGGLITQQDYHSPRGDMPNTAFREHFGNFNFRFKMTPQQQLRLNAQIYRLSDAGFPGQAAEIPDDDRDAFALQYMIRPHSSRINRLQFSASYLRMFHHMLVHAVDNPMMRVDADVKATSKTYAAKFRSSLPLSRKWSSLVGGDFYRWNGDAARQRIILQKMQGTQKRTGDETLWPGVNIDDFGIFSQNTFLLHERFNLEAGLRFDRISADGNLPVNSKITVAPNFSKNFVGGNLIGTYHISPAVSARLGLGRAFRAPDPSELYISLPLPVGTGNPPLAFFLGNPKLDLEKSWQIEAGLGGKKTRWQWNINLFYHRVEDLILAVITGDSLSNLPVRQYRNLPLAILAGGEASLHWQPVDKLALQSVLSYTWGETRSLAAGIPNRAPLPEIPPFDLTSSIRYNILPAWYVQMRWRVVAAQNRAAEYTRELATGGFQTMDVKTWYQWHSNLTLVAGIRNLFNKTYAEHLSQLGRTRSVAIQQHLDRILEPGRDVYLSLEWHF
ncbi:MAG: TonB-dependent receptor [Calditrichaeota bacterium]|nr:MAG: TonB-dependent receptor [Calditrichota bacterium]